MTFSDVGNKMPEFQKFLNGASAQDCVRNMYEEPSTRTKHLRGKYLVDFFMAAVSRQNWAEDASLKTLVDAAFTDLTRRVAIPCKHAHDGQGKHIKENHKHHGKEKHGKCHKKDKKEKHGKCHKEKHGKKDKHHKDKHCHKSESNQHEKLSCEQRIRFNSNQGRYQDGINLAVQAKSAREAIQAAEREEARRQAEENARRQAEENARREEEPRRNVASGERLPQREELPQPPVVQPELPVEPAQPIMGPNQVIYCPAPGTLIREPSVGERILEVAQEVAPIGAAILGGVILSQLPQLLPASPEEERGRIIVEEGKRGQRIERRIPEIHIPERPISPEPRVPSPAPEEKDQGNQSPAVDAATSPVPAEDEQGPDMSEIAQQTDDIGQELINADSQTEEPESLQGRVVVQNYGATAHRWGRERRFRSEASLDMYRNVDHNTEAYFPKMREALGMLNRWEFSNENPYSNVVGLFAADFQLFLSKNKARRIEQLKTLHPQCLIYLYSHKDFCKNSFSADPATAAAQKAQWEAEMREIIVASASSDRNILQIANVENFVEQSKNAQSVRAKFEPLLPRLTAIKDTLYSLGLANQVAMRLEAAQNAQLAAPQQQVMGLLEAPQNGEIVAAQVQHVANAALQGASSNNSSNNSESQSSNNGAAIRRDQERAREAALQSASSNAPSNSNNGNGNSNSNSGNGNSNSNSNS